MLSRMNRTLMMGCSLALVACGGGGGDGTTTGGDALSLFPTSGYAAVFDDGSAGELPLSIMGGAHVSWAAADPHVVRVTGDDASAHALALATGQTAVSASAADGSVSANVTVVRYAASARSAGQASYAKLACGGCHGAGGPDITPSGIGKHSDAQIMGAVAHGMNPEGGEVSVGAAQHSFAADPGIVAYLRSLAPAGIPEQDD